MGMYFVMQCSLSLLVYQKLDWIFFVGNLFIEIIFNLDGLGLLGFEAIVQRDYPVIFGTLFIFTLMGLILRLISDVMYQMIDPRINFDSQGAK
jgi:ABC-type uncharacterized transport system, permease component